MSYTISNYDGSTFATIPDGTLNTQSSLVLVGKNWSGYGAYLDSNFLWLMQNFAGPSSPSTPVVGQMWWNKTGNVMSVYTGNVWKQFGSTTVANTTPSTTNAVTGDLWWNTTAGTLNAFNGTSFVAIGPSVTNGTGALTTILSDTSGNNHSVIELIANNNVIGIISQDTFVPAPSVPGFTGILPGYNVSGNIGGLGNVGGYSGAAFVSVTGNITAANFIGNFGNSSSNVVGANAVFGNVFIGNISANGSYGSNGYVLTSGGPNVSAYWAPSTGGGNIAIAVSGANTSLYPMFANVTSGNLSTAFVANSVLTFNPTSGALTANNMVSSAGIALNANTITQSYTVPAGYNGVSAGPITLAAGVVVTVANNSNWSIV